MIEQIDFVFFLLARDSWSKLRSPLARSSVHHCSFGLMKTFCFSDIGRKEAWSFIPSESTFYNFYDQ